MNNKIDCKILDRDYFDEIEAKLPDGYELLRNDVKTQDGDLLYNPLRGGWRLDNIVDKRWRQSPDYHYPNVSFFVGVARRSANKEEEL